MNSLEGLIQNVIKGIIQKYPTRLLCWLDWDQESFDFLCSECLKDPSYAVDCFELLWMTKFYTNHEVARDFETFEATVKLPKEGFVETTIFTIFDDQEETFRKFVLDRVDDVTVNVIEVTRDIRLVEEYYYKPIINKEDLSMYKATNILTAASENKKKHEGDEWYTVTHAFIDGVMWFISQMERGERRERAEKLYKDLTDGFKESNNV